MIQLIKNLYNELEDFEIHSSLGTVILPLALFVLCMVYLLKRSKSSPPGPKGVPVLGVLPLITDRPDKVVMKWAQEFGDVMTLPFINNKVVVISSMDALNEGPVHKGEDYADRPYCFFHDYILMRNGISSSNSSPEWRDQRRFTLTSLRKFGFGKPAIISKINDEADFFCEAMIACNGDFSKGRNLLTELNANIILQLCLNRRCEYNGRKKFIKFFHKVSKKFNDASFAIQATIFVPWMYHFPPFRGVLNDLKDFFLELEAGIAEELEDHYELSEPGVIRDLTDDYIREMNSRDATNRGSFSKTTLLYILRDFFLAGTETMASTLTWAILILCNRRDTVLKKIHDEIDRVLGSETKPDGSHRVKMPYVMAFLQELLRYRTILPFGVPRMTTRDTKLGKYIIPAGTTVLENLYGVHNDPKVWDHPEEFRVERHLNEKQEFVKSKHVIPFGVGVRYCIGKQLAEVQMFIVLVRILQRFDLISEATEFQDEEPAQGGFVTMVPFDTKIKLVEKN